MELCVFGSRKIFYSRIGNIYIYPVDDIDIRTIYREFNTMFVRACSSGFGLSLFICSVVVFLGNLPIRSSSLPDTCEDFFRDDDSDLSVYFHYPSVNFDTWNAANSYCNPTENPYNASLLLGGTVIPDQFFMGSAYETLRETLLRTIPTMLENGNKTIWIGAKKSGSDWIWTNDEKLTTVSVDAGGVNVGECVYMDLETGKLSTKDVSCDDQMHFVCMAPLFSCPPSACPPGSFHNIPILGNDTCSPANSSNCTTITGTCEICEPGRYQNISSQTSCEVCPPGFASPKVGQNNVDVCQVCEAGSYSLGSGSSGCNNCIAGTYSPFSGASSVEECQSCPAGSISPIESATVCKDCIPGRYMSESGSGLTECYPCPNGKWSNVTAASNFVCQDCPGTGFICENASDIPSLLSGFWRDPDDFTVAWRCIPSYACLDTKKMLITECMAGYMGPRCSVCTPGEYYRFGSTCKKCSIPNGFKWFLIVVLILMLAFIVLGLMLFPLSKPHVDIRIMVSWLQILALYPKFLESWPPTLVEFFDISSLLNLDFQFLGITCDASWSFWSFYVVKLFLPFVVVLFFMLCLFLYYGVVLFRRLFQFPRIDVHIWSRIANSFMFTLSFMYTLLATTSVEPFDCIEQPSGMWTMVSDPTQTCFDDHWRRWFGVSLFFCLFYLIILPFTLGSFFYVFRGWFKSSRFKETFGSLTLPYQKDFFWWEFVNIAHKSGVVAVGQLSAASASRSVRLFLVVLTVVARMYLENTFQPYADPRDNQLAFTWAAVDSLTLLTGFIFQSSVTESGERSFFTILVVLFPLVAGIATFKHFFEPSISYLRSKLPTVYRFHRKTPSPSSSHSSPSSLLKPGFSSLDDDLANTETTNKLGLMVESEVVPVQTQKEAPEDFENAKDTGIEAGSSHVEIPATIVEVGVAVENLDSASDGEAGATNQEIQKSKHILSPKNMQENNVEGDEEDLLPPPDEKVESKASSPQESASSVNNVDDNAIKSESEVADIDALPSGEETSVGEILGDLLAEPSDYSSRIFTRPK